MPRGRKRKEATKPAPAALSGLRKKVTFSRRGRRDGHEGRQYTPVEDTAKTKRPSWLGSRLMTASHCRISLAWLMSGTSVRLSIALLVMNPKICGLASLRYPYIAVKLIFCAMLVRCFGGFLSSHCFWGHC